MLTLDGRALRHLGAKDIGEDGPPVRPPPFIMWSVPKGAVVASPTVELAQESAQNFAGEHPGQVVAIYGLIGYAYTPRKPAPFLAAPEPSVLEDARAAQETNVEQAVSSGARPARMV